MSDVDALAVPYERQSAGNMCGAAALTMAYRWLGMECTQAELWPSLAIDGRGTRTQRLVRDALERGFEAAAVQLAKPWPALQRCIKQSLAVIVNYRPSATSKLGHFSLAIAAGDDCIQLHDPARGPDRVIPKEDFLGFWMAHLRAPISGWTMAVIGRPSLRLERCDRCETVLPESIVCLGCKHEYHLRPAAAFGCVRSDCPNCDWFATFCPRCEVSYERHLGNWGIEESHLNAISGVQLRTVASTSLNAIPLRNQVE